jgi:hypothetical protein
MLARRKFFAVIAAGLLGLVPVSVSAQTPKAEKPKPKTIKKLQNKQSSRN